MASKNVTNDVAPPVPSVENGFYSFFSVLQPGFAVVSSISIDEIEEEQPGKVYVFDEQYEVSKEAEEWFIRFALRWKAKGIIRDFMDVRKNIHYQDVDVDFICILPDGTRRTYEVKGDFTKTGNLFAEYAVPTYVVDDNDRRKIITRYAKLGWLYRSQADYIFYYYSAFQKIYMFDLPYFAAWVDSMSLQCNFKKRRKAIPFPIRGAKNLVSEDKPYGSYYYGLGYIVPLKEIESSYQKNHFLKIYHITSDSKKEKATGELLQQSEKGSESRHPNQ